MQQQHQHARNSSLIIMVILAIMLVGTIINVTMHKDDVVRYINKMIFKNNGVGILSSRKKNNLSNLFMRKHGPATSVILDDSLTADTEPTTAASASIDNNFSNSNNGKTSSKASKNSFIHAADKEDTIYINNTSLLSQVYIPFSSIESMNDYILNKLPKNWLGDMTSFSEVTFVLLEDRISATSGPSALERSKLEYKLDFAKANEPRKIIRSRVNVMSCEVPDGFATNKLHPSGPIMFATLLCLDRNQHKNSRSFAILTESMYVDPFDFQLVLDSLQISEYNPIIIMEDEALLSSTKVKNAYLHDLFNSPQAGAVHNLKHVLTEQRFFNRGFHRFLIRFHLTGYTIATLNYAIESKIITVDDHPKRIGLYRHFPYSKNLLESHQHLNQHRGIRSCSLPQTVHFSFHQVFISTFKSCSFVGSIKRKYEPHSIRFLQRVSRGKDHEIVWKEDQLLDKEAHCDVAIGVTSRIPNIWERMLVRKTWGAVARSMGTVKLFFVYGHSATNLTQTSLRQLQLENDFFNDIVVLPTTEGYFQMFNKVMAWFGWAVQNTNCDAVMKIDPDTYARMFPLMKFLFKHDILPLERSLLPSKEGEAGVYFGMANWKSVSIRDEKHVWYFYDKWPHEFLPTFMTGAIFGLSRTFAKYVYEHRVPDMRLDDPGIGAILHHLKKRQSNLVRYETSEDWFAAIYNPCRMGKIYDNPYFNHNFNMLRIFNHDFFGESICKYLQNVTIDLKDLVSIDNAVTNIPPLKEIKSKILDTIDSDVFVNNKLFELEENSEEGKAKGGIISTSWLTFDMFMFVAPWLFVIIMFSVVIKRRQGKPPSSIQNGSNDPNHNA